MKAIIDIPDDPTLPGLAAVRALGVTRALGLARTVLALGLEDGPVSVQLLGYTPGARATLELRVGPRRLAVKAYATDPTPEAALYQALGAAGLAGDSGVRVPPLFAWDRELRVLVIGWLEGPTVHDLVKNGQGQRAGDLAARWIERSATLPVTLGLPFSSARMLRRAGEWIAELEGADPALGAAAKALAAMLERTLPADGTPRLVHGTFYARHVLDLGDGPGIIDWERFGQGPLELDAGMFLATIWRLGLDHESLAGEAVGATDAFLARTGDILDERALCWHQAAALLRLASKVHVVKRRKDNWVARAQAMLDEAMRLAQRAARRQPVTAASRPTFLLNGAGLELVLQALSTRPATREELEHIRKLLVETRNHVPEGP